MLNFLDKLFLDKPIESPATCQVKKSKPVSRTPAKKPDNVVYSLGRAFVRKETPDGFEDELLLTNSVKSSGLTEHDKQVIGERNLNERKFVKVKPYWTKGWSAARIARELRNEPGHGQRTLDKYLSAMNEADRRRQTTTPPPKK